MVARGAPRELTGPGAAERRRGVAAATLRRVSGLEQAVEELGRRVARLEDELAILAALASYGQTIDAKDPDDPSFVDCFTEDAFFSWRPTPTADPRSEARGRDGLTEWFRNLSQNIPEGSSSMPRPTSACSRSTVTMRPRKAGI